MTQQPIGDQLDALGLTFDIEDGGKVVKADVEVTIEYPNRFEVPKQSVPVDPAGMIPVPHPIESRVITVCRGEQNLNDEQRERVCTWLRANDIDPRLVAAGEVTVTRRERNGQPPGPSYISFTQYFIDETGQKTVHANAPNTPVTLRRHVIQKVELPPEPSGDAHE